MTYPSILRSSSRALIALSLVFAIGCGSVVSPPETGADSASADSASADSTTQPDSNASDGSAMDARADSASDAGGVDSATMDAAASDATTDARATSDGASADSADAATCSVLGDWNGTAAMLGMVSFRFRANGTWQGATGSDMLGSSSAIELGNFAQGANLVLTNDPGTSGCAMTDRGEYRLTFDASCSQMTWTLVSDTCTSRGAALNGAVFTRVASTDAGVATDSGSSVDGGSCRMVGDWTGSFSMPMGVMVYFRFAPTTWQAALSLADFMAGRFVDIGNANESSTSIVLTNDASGSSGCAPSDRGEYSIVYGSGCATARWTLISDTCAARGTALNGSTFTRM